MKRLVLILLCLLVAVPAAAQTQIPKDSGSGYQRVFTAIDEVGFYDVGKAFPMALVGFELGSVFVGELFACQGPAVLFNVDTCDSITVLSADVGPLVFQTARLYYVVQVTTQETTGNQSRLVIRGTEGQVSGIGSARDIFAGLFGGGGSPTTVSDTVWRQLEIDFSEGTDSSNFYTVNPTGDLVCNTSGGDLAQIEMLLTATMQHIDTQTRDFNVRFGVCVGCSGDVFPQLTDGNQISGGDMLVSFHNNVNFAPVPLGGPVPIGNDVCIGLMVIGANNRAVQIISGTWSLYSGGTGAGASGEFTSLLGLDDVQESTFLGAAGQALIVNGSETGIEFTVPGANEFSRIGTNTTEVLTANDFPDAVGGVITLPSGVYILQDNITLPDAIQPAAGAVVELTAIGAGPTLIYTGTGAFIQDALVGDLFLLESVNVTLTGNGASLFDTTGTGILIDRASISATGTGASLGITRNHNLAFSLRSSEIVGFTDGLQVVNSPLFLVNDVAFVSPASGGTALFDIDAATVTVQLDNLTIMHAASEDLFDIDSSYTGFATITRINNIGGSNFFAAGGLNETDTHIVVSASPPQKNSMNIGSVVVVNNTTVTDMAGGPNVWTDVNFGTSATLGSNAELWTLNSSATGELLYIGLSPISGEVGVAMSSVSSGGTQEFQFRIVKNGNPLPDGVVMARDISISIGTTGVISPITVVTGDLVRFQIQNVDGTSDITVSQFSMAVK